MRVFRSPPPARVIATSRLRQRAQTLARRPPARQAHREVAEVGAKRERNAAVRPSRQMGTAARLPADLTGGFRASPLQPSEVLAERAGAALPSG